VFAGQTRADVLCRFNDVTRRCPLSLPPLQKRPEDVVDENAELWGNEGEDTGVVIGGGEWVRLDV
jgi:hypothetical protein